MAVSRHLKSLKDILEAVRKDHRFLKISVKKGKESEFSVTRVQISGQASFWSKNEDVVYSLATGLAGRESDVMEYLRYRGDNSDMSSGEVSKDFQDDKRRWITSRNYEEHYDVIEGMKAHRKETSAPSAKTLLPEPDRIPDLLQRVRELRGQVPPAGRTSKADVMKSVLKNLEDPSVRYRIHNCAPDGSQIRKTTSGNISKQSIPLSKNPSSPLSRCYIPANYDNRRFVVNFMTLYYMYEDHLRQPEAATKARAFAEDLLVEYKKKVKSSSPRGRSTSSKSRTLSSSPRRSSSPAADKDATVSSPAKKRSVSVSSKRAASPSKSVKPERSSSPRSPSRRAAKTGDPSQTVSVESKGSSRAASRSPPRSPSASTSPKVGKKLSLPLRR